MMADKILHKALVVVADGTGARFFRNSGDEGTVSLSAEGEFNPTNLFDDGPAEQGHRSEIRLQGHDGQVCQILCGEEVPRRTERFVPMARPRKVQ
jgi:protein required for attachment to host cells